MKKKIVPIHYYREWENHPMTLIVSEIFKKIVEEDSANFFDAMKADESPTSIALKAAEIRGRNKVMKKFYELLARDQEGKEIELRMKVDMLDKYIDWEQ